MKNKNIIFPIVLFFIALALFSPVLFHPNEMIGETPNDIWTIMLPFKTYLYNSFQATGELPLWNYLVFSGTPFVGNPHATLFYPLHLPFYFFPPEFVFGPLFFLHFFLGGLFMYYFLRELKLSECSAFIGGVTFLLSHKLLTHLYAGHMVFMPILFFPLILLFIEKLISSNSKKHSLLYSLFITLVLSIQYLGIHTQVFFYGLVMCIAYFGIGLIARYKREKKSRDFFIKGLFLGFALILFVLMIAIQLLPTYELTQYSNRKGGLTYDDAVDTAYPLAHATTILIPNFFGSPLDQSYWGFSNYWELSSYAGIVALFFALLALLFYRNRITLFFAGVVLFSYLFSLDSPFFSFFFHFIPGFGFFRAPHRMLFMVTLAMPILCSFGYYVLAEGKYFKKTLNKTLFISFLSVFLGFIVLAGLYLFRHKIILKISSLIGAQYQALSNTHTLTVQSSHFIDRFANFYPTLLQNIGLFLLFALAIVLVVHLFVSKKISLQIFFIFVVSLIIIDAYFASAGLIGTVPISDMYQEDPLYALFNMLAEENHSDSDHSGINPSSINPSSINPSDNLYRVYDVSSNRLLRPHITAKKGIQTVNGIDPLHLQSYADFFKLAGNYSFSSYSFRVPPWQVPKKNLQHPDTKLLGLLNTKFVILSEQSQNPQLKLIMKKDHRFIYENLDVLPRAYTVKLFYDGAFLHDDDSADFFYDTGFVPQKITKYTANTIHLDVNTKKNATLVLSEVWYPGWKAFVDGEEVEIEKVYDLFRSVKIPKGNHKVIFSYEPKSYQLGKTVSIVSLFIVLALISFLLFNLRRK